MSGGMIKVSAGIPPDGRRAARPREKKNTECVLLIKARVALPQREMRFCFLGVCWRSVTKKGERKKTSERCELASFFPLFFFTFVYSPRFSEHKTFSCYSSVKEKHRQPTASALCCEMNLCAQCEASSEHLS